MVGIELVEDVAREKLEDADIGFIAPGTLVGIEVWALLLLANESVEDNEVGNAMFIFPAIDAVGIGSCVPSLLAPGSPKGVMPGFRLAPEEAG